MRNVVVKGDKVRIVMDVGAGGTQEFTVEATKDGRRVEIDSGTRVTTVTEVMHTGREVRTARFMSSRVVALIEEPASEPESPGALFPVREA